MQTYLAHDSSTVVAGVRDSNHSSAKALEKLCKGQSSKLIVVKTENLILQDAADAVKDIESAHGITSLGAVIANGCARALQCKCDRPPLLKSRNPKFVTMGSTVGSIAGIEALSMPNAAYGTSKAALNYVTRKVHVESINYLFIAAEALWPRVRCGKMAAKLWRFKF